jgi:hypothetical protein
MRKIVFGVLLVLIGVSASSADSLVSSGNSSSVESSSASLDQTLRVRDQELTDLRRWQSLEMARVQQQSTLLAATASAGQDTINWLEGQFNPTVTGITPIAGREGLVLSYTVPTSDPSAASLRGRSWTYDNAVTAVGLLMQGRTESARTILSALQRLTNTDGSIAFSFQINSLAVDARVRTGTVAWAGYAMAYYQSVTGDTSFQATAEKISAYLKTLQLASGSLKGGPDVSWVSTEHNIDAYFFYRQLYRITNNTAYQTTANRIKNSLLTNHWVSTRTGGNFLQGIGDNTPSLDANSWGALFLNAIGDTAKANQAMQFVESKFKNTQTISGSRNKMTGYSPDSAKKTVWLEGTLGVAAAYQRMGNATNVSSIMTQVNALKTTWQSQGKWHGALAYAIPRYTDPTGNTFVDLESAASTGWWVITQAIQAGDNTFWNRD